MKQYWCMIACLALTGCLKVPEGPPQNDAGDMASTTDDMGDETTDAVDSYDATDGADIGPRTEITLPLPVLKVGLGETFGSDNAIRYLRRELMFRFNADIFVGSTAQVVGRRNEFDALFIESAEDVEVGALMSAETPVFTMSELAAERFGIAEPEVGGLPMLSMTLTADHPNPAAYEERTLLRSEDNLHEHPSFAQSATVYANGMTEGAVFPVMVGVETGAELLNDLTAPGPRGYFAGRSYTALSLFGEAALMDVVARTFGVELPPADKTCGLITAFSDRSGSFADRLKLHGCDVKLLEPNDVDSTGLDLIVIGPGMDELATAQLLAPQAAPVVAFYEGDELARGFELLAENPENTTIEITSMEVLPRADELLGTSAEGTLDISLNIDNFDTIPPGLLVVGTEVLATFSTGQPAVFAVDRGVPLATLDTKARFILLPSTILNADSSEGSYSPYLPALDFVDHAIQWALAKETE